MALGRKQGNGLDISGVGKQRVKLSGGGMNSRSGLQMANPGGGGARQKRRSSRGSSRSQESYVSGGKRTRGGRFPRKTLLILLAVMAGAVLLAVAVGYAVYQQTVKNALKPDIDVQNLSSVLAQPSSGDDAVWSVLVKTDASSAEAGRGKIQDLALVYADSNNKTLSFLWIPADTRVYLDQYGYKTVGEGFSLLGETGVVKSVSRLADVSISHYMEVNEAGLERFEEDLAPLEVDAKNSGRDEETSALCKRVCGSSSEQMSEFASYFTGCFASDMDSNAAAKLFASVQGLDVSTDLYQADAPVKAGSQDGSTFEELDSDSWNSMVARTANGLSPVASKRELERYEAMRASATIDIWNGTKGRVANIASDCGKELTKIGWKVGKVGNAAQPVYTETLVVYNDSKDRKLAELVVSDLGQGRVVRGAARYSFTGDVLVVLGDNYRPY